MTKQTESSRFLEAMKQIVSVPKAEIDRREAAYRAMRKTQKEAKAPLKGIRDLRTEPTKAMR